MVKRVKTPEAVEEAKYYTCYKPYPLHADFEIPDDYIPFCRWIATVLGGHESLYCVYFKPKARGMVQFSVSKEFKEPERLLGEHRWSEFLKEPQEDEKELVSQIFYSTYTTDREVQKDGWKCIFVEDVFFHGWGVKNKHIKLPYPTTYWCTTPPENKMEKALCRPIPVGTKPPPTAAPPPRPVVGSEGWIESKQGKDGVGRGKTAANRVGGSQKKASAAAPKGRGSTTWDKPILVPQSGWTSSQSASFPTLGSSSAGKNKSAPAPSPTSAQPQSAWGKKPAPTPVPAASAQSAWGQKPAPTSPPVASAQSQSVWGKKPAPVRSPLPASSTSAPQNAPSTSNKATSTKSPEVYFPPPGLGPSRHSNHAQSTTSPPERTDVSPQMPIPPGLTKKPAIEPEKVVITIDSSRYEHDDDYVMEETYHGFYQESWETASVYRPSEAGSVSVNLGGKGKGKKASRYTPTITEADDREEVEQKEDVPENPWSTTIYRPTGSVTAAALRAREEKTTLCPVHGGKCKKGICTEYAKARRQERFAEKERRREERRGQRREKAAMEELEEKEDGKWNEQEDEGFIEKVEESVFGEREEGNDNNEGEEEDKQEDEEPKKQKQPAKGKPRRWADQSSEEGKDAPEEDVVQELKKENQPARGRPVLKAWADYSSEEEGDYFEGEGVSRNTNLYASDDDEHYD